MVNIDTDTGPALHLQPHPENIRELLANQRDRQSLYRGRTQTMEDMSLWGNKFILADSRTLPYPDFHKTMLTVTLPRAVFILEDQDPGVGKEM